MRILVVHNSYSENSVSGENIVFYKELRLLKDKLGSENVFEYSVSNDASNFIVLLFNIFFSVKHYFGIKKMVSENNIDIVHVHNFFPLLSPSIFLAAKASKAKTVLTLHNYRMWCSSGLFYRKSYGICELCVGKNFSIWSIWHKCYRDSFFQSFVVELVFFLYDKLNVFRFIDSFFVLTEFQYNKVLELGVDSKRVLIKPNSIAIIKPSKISNHNNYIYVGRIEESKGIIELLEIWIRLDVKYILTIVGNGELLDLLRDKYVATNIFFLGKQTKEDTLSLISSSKYLIQPSLCYETFGLTILEAMMSSVPVIGFDIGTRSQFIKDGVNGYLAQRNNLQKIIEHSYNNVNYDDFQKESFKLANEYEDHIVIRRQIKLYSDMISKNFSRNE